MGLDRGYIPGDLTQSQSRCRSGELLLRAIIQVWPRRQARSLFPVLSPSRIESKDTATSRSEVGHVRYSRIRLLRKRR
jgi:hypothetical protein